MNKHIPGIQTSVSISPSLLEEIRVLNTNSTLSQFLEDALSFYLAELKRQARRQRDREIINANADRFNKEAEENLEFQDL